MVKKQLIPKLRFSEFSDNWEKHKLKDITSYVDYRGRAPKKSENGHFLVTAKNIKKGYIDYECSKEFVSEVDYSTVMSKGLPKIGDVLFTTEAPMGNVAQVNIDNIALAQRVIKFRGKVMLENNYLLHYFLSEVFQKTISRKSIGTTVQGISGKELHKTLIALPTLPEQHKIASFLTSVDNKLEQLNKKKTLLDQYKKGMMQQIFSQQLRFKDENGNNYPDWEKKKLGEIGKTLNGLTGKTKEDFGVGKPYIQYKQIFDSSKIKIDNCGLVNISESDNQQTVQFGDVLFTTSSETPNEIGTASVLLDDVKEMYLNSFCFGFRVNKNTLNPSFAQFLFRSPGFRNKMIPLAQGSTRYNISKSSFIKLKIDLPLIQEQTQIANFLSAIDIKIEQVQTQIDYTNSFKKGLLQQMFV